MSLSWYKYKVVYYINLIFLNLFSIFFAFTGLTYFSEKEYRCCLQFNFDYLQPGF